VSAALPLERMEDIEPERGLAGFGTDLVAGDQRHVPVHRRVFDAFGHHRDAQLLPARDGLCPLAHREGTPEVRSAVSVTHRSACARDPSPIDRCDGSTGDVGAIDAERDRGLHDRRPESLGIDATARGQ
jgi:hypothetical protein